MYIIVDAVDESPNRPGIPSPREKVLQLMEELVDLHRPDIRICLTSRPEVDIRMVLEPLSSHAVSLHDECAKGGYYQLHRVGCRVRCEHAEVEVRGQANGYRFTVTKSERHVRHRIKISYSGGSRHDTGSDGLCVNWMHCGVVFQQAFGVP